MNKILNKLKKLAKADKQELLGLINKRLWSITARAKSGHTLKYREIHGEYEDVEKTVLSRPVNIEYYHKAYYSFLDKITQGGFFINKTDDSQPDIIRKQLGKEKTDALIDEADALTKNSFNIFDLHGYQYGDQINWNLNPKTGKEWPAIFCEDIGYRGPTSFGDIKYSWESARHQHLIKLGQAYRLTGDEKYALVFKEHVESFISQNPPYLGIHWTSGLELGIRTISWIWAMAFFSGSKSIPEKFFLKMIWSVEQQAKCIEANLSLGKYANNHLIGEAASLAIVGCMFPALSRAGKWLKKGLKITEAELFKQTCPDGSGVEQAYSYLRFILDFYLQVYVLLKKDNISFNIEIWNRIEKIFEFIMYTMTPSGEGPGYGDSDNARGVVLSNSEFNDYRGIMAVGAALFKRTDFKYVSQDRVDELAWMFGPEGVEEYQSIESTPPGLTSMNLPYGGYSVSRDHWGKDSYYMLIDHGLLGYGSCAHGHADALSFVLHLNGVPVFVDPGTHNYNTSMEYRNYFRGTSAHNTLYIDRNDQAVNSGRMSWASPYKSKGNYSEFLAKFDFIECFHDGYTRLADPVLHKRRIFYAKNNYWIIEDLIDGKADHEVWDNYHFHPDINPEILEDGTVILKHNSNPFMLLEAFSSGHLLPKIYRDSHDPVMGHYSRGYGEMIPISTLSFQCRIKAPFVTTKVFSRISNRQEKITVKRVKDAGFYIVKHLQGTDIIVTGDHGKDENGFQFNGNLVFINCDKKNTPVYMFYDGSGLSIQGNAILNSEDVRRFEIMNDKVTPAKGVMDQPVINIPEFKEMINKYLTSFEKGVSHA